MTLLAIVAAVCVVYALAWWSAGRGLSFFRSADDDTASAMGGVVGELTELFQPSRRIETEERARQREAWQEAEEGAPPFELDVATGKAVLRVRKPRR